MNSKSGRPYLIDEKVVVALKSTGLFNPQVNKNLVSKCLITKDDLDLVEAVSRFHFYQHLGDPDIHRMTLFYNDALLNATNFQFRILDDRANIWLACNVVLSFLTIKKKAVTKTK
jgi:hypothetical protein